MPARLRPTATLAGDAILVGDPGRALLLAQELLVEPKMSNHARGLWGYSGATEAGRRLTIQSTGMGGPSATLVLTDLVELGVRRAVRVGTCVALDKARELGELLVVGAALAVGGSAVAHGALAGEAIRPSADLTGRLVEAPGVEAAVAIASLDVHPPVKRELGDDVAAADMQTAALLAQGRRLEVELAALLIVAETSAGEQISAELLESRERLAGRAATAAL